MIAVPHPMHALARLTWHCGVASAALMLCPAQAREAADPGVRALADLSLEDLMRVEVVSASRGHDTLEDVAAPVFVITRDDIVRTGVRSIPEALRLAPGVDVAQLSSSRWAVGVRGDAGRFSNKLQVLLDGRSLYSPMFAGVIWEAERVALSDIERIEIIRGPAGAMWGANAVNGVINIITRTAQDTQGTQVETVLASDGSRLLGVRYGAGSGGAGGAAPASSGPESSFWRLHAQVDSTRDSVLASGDPAYDHSVVRSWDWRWDQQVESGLHLSSHAQVVQSLTHDLRLRPQPSAPYWMTAPTEQLIEQSVIGGSWQQRLSDRSDLRVLAEGVHVQGHEQAFVALNTDQIDVEIEHRWRPADSAHQVTWGGGLRWYQDHLQVLGLGYVNPAFSRSTNTRWFAQDRWHSPDQRWMVQAGVRIDHNHYTHAQVQPSVAVSWRASPDWLWWSSVARAAREASRGEEDAHLYVGVVPPSEATAGLPLMLANRDKLFAHGAESVQAYQMGVRGRLNPAVWLDVTVFQHRYDPLLFTSLQPGVVTPVMAAVPYLDGALQAVLGKGEVTGVELASHWRIASQWHQQLSWTEMSTRVEPQVAGATTSRLQNPRRLLSWRMSYDPSPLWTLDAWLRYTGARPGDSVVGSQPLGRVLTLDLSGRWSVARNTSLTFTARHLGPRRRLEIRPDMGYSVPVHIERSVGVAANVAF